MLQGKQSIVSTDINHLNLVQSIISQV